MKLKLLTLLGFLSLGGGQFLSAQDYDDIYYDGSKSNKNDKVIVTESNDSYRSNSYTNDNRRAINMIDERDVDDYNRRSMSKATDAGYDSTDSVGSSEDSFVYTDRIKRFHNPSVIVESNDEDLVDLYVYTRPSVNIIVGSSSYYSPWSSFSYYGCDSWYWDAWNSPYYPWYTHWARPYYSWYGPGWGWNNSWYGWNRPWYGSGWYNHGGMHHNPVYGGHYGNGGRRPAGYGSDRYNNGSRPGYATGYRPGSNSRPSNAGYRPGQNGSRRPSSSGIGTNSGYNGHRGSSNFFESRQNNNVNMGGRRPNSSTENNSSSYSRPSRNTYDNNSNRGSYNSPSRSSGSSSGGGYSGGGGRSSGGGGGHRR